MHFTIKAPAQVVVRAIFGETVNFKQFVFYLFTGCLTSMLLKMFHYCLEVFFVFCI